MELVRSSVVASRAKALWVHCLDDFGRPEPYLSKGTTQYKDVLKGNYDVKKANKFFHNNFEATSTDNQ